MSEQRRSARFIELYTGNYDRVSRFIARRLEGDQVSDAEDLTAEVFKIAWTRALGDIQVTPGWLFVTAKNLLRNRARSLQRGEAALRSIRADLRTAASTDRLDEEVITALVAIGYQHREILTLRYWDELTASEISALLGISVSAVWVRTHRARRAFEESFKTTSGGRNEQD